jgi:hypothetical protein
MKGATRRLLEGCIDYAGLFPPAQLSMAESFANYLSYRNGPEGWIMDRFVCGANQLSALAEALKQANPSSAVSVSVVGSRNPIWEEGLISDADAMTRFMETAGEFADLEAYEKPLPATGDLAELLSDLRAFNQVETFCEIPWGCDLPEAIGSIAGEEWLGAKVRTGGLQADAFPSSEELALFIQQCIQLEVPFKLTAGLHHPVRSFRQDVNTKMHGFLNTLAAAGLTYSQDLTAKELENILESEDPADFGATDQEFRFKNWKLDLEEIEATRALFVSFGSCSVIEPLADLAELNL